MKNLIKFFTATSLLIGTLCQADLPNTGIKKRLLKLASEEKKSSPQESRPLVITTKKVIDEYNKHPFSIVLKANGIDIAAVLERATSSQKFPVIKSYSNYLEYINLERMVDSIFDPLANFLSQVIEIFDQLSRNQSNGDQVQRKNLEMAEKAFIESCLELIFNKNKKFETTEFTSNQTISFAEVLTSAAHAFIDISDLYEIVLHKIAAKAQFSLAPSLSIPTISEELEDHLFATQEKILIMKMDDVALEGSSSRAKEQASSILEGMRNCIHAMIQEMWAEEISLAETIAAVKTKNCQSLTLSDFYEWFSNQDF